jgi:N-carbamoyl-L-amino-acid hydrolase
MTGAQPNLRIDGDRLWASLMRMAEIGATPKGGVCRLALSDEDKIGRDLFVDWCRQAGCSIRVDAVGNIFARRPGKRDDLTPVRTGSHLDSQPTGGKFDGVYGVLAGLEVLRTLNDREIATERPVEVVVWTNEEGCRFAPAMVGSGVHVGKFDLADALGKTDLDGKAFGDELRRIGYAGTDEVSPRDAAAFFEVHIEQGPILEAEKKTIGVVKGAQGQRWFDVTVTGQEAHAGPTPMKVRKDALVGAARIVALVNRIGLENQPYACATVGQMTVRPNSRNTIPGRVEFTIDFRHPDDAILTKMKATLEAEAAKLCADAGLDLDCTEIWYQPPLAFDADCVAAVRAGAAACGFDAMEIVSGAGHDACHMATVAPTGMIFVPCEDGISHNEVENATKADIAAGCDVLLRAVLDRANAA